MFREKKERHWLIRGLSKRLDDLRLVTVDCNIFLFTVSPDLSEPNNSMLDKKKLETHGLFVMEAFIIEEKTTQEEMLGGFHLGSSVSQVLSKFF